MLSARTLAFTFGLLLATALPLRADTPPVKVAVVNLNRVFNEMQETKDLQAKMESDRGSLNGLAKEKEDKVKSLKEARDQLRSDSPQFQERNKEYLQAGIELESWSKLTQLDLQQSLKLRTKGLFDKIQAVVGRVAKDKSLDLVIADQRTDVPEDLDKVTVDQLKAIINQRDVLFANEKVDISNDVIAGLDADYKAKK